MCSKETVIDLAYFVSCLSEQALDLWLIKLFLADENSSEFDYDFFCI